MRKAFLIFLFAPFLIGAQQYGNEWINFSQQYFKIPIYKTGIHRLEYSTIKISFFQAGIDISDIGINEFQVFGREKEVALFIEDEDNNGFLNGDDYIEFYAGLIALFIPHQIMFQILITAFLTIQLDIF